MKPSEETALTQLSFSLKLKWEVFREGVGSLPTSSIS